MSFHLPFPADNRRPGGYCEALSVSLCLPPLPLRHLAFDLLGRSYASIATAWGCEFFLASAIFPFFGLKGPPPPLGRCPSRCCTLCPAFVFLCSRLPSVIFDLLGFPPPLPPLWRPACGGVRRIYLSCITAADTFRRNCACAGASPPPPPDDGLCPVRTVAGWCPIYVCAKAKRGIPKKGGSARNPAGIP